MAGGTVPITKVGDDALFLSTHVAEGHVGDARPVEFAVSSNVDGSIVVEFARDLRRRYIVKVKDAVFAAYALDSARKDG